MATKSVTKILQEARELILDPDHWIRGHSARTSRRGAVVNLHSPRATCFCASGAIRRASGENTGANKGAHESPERLLQRAIRDGLGNKLSRVTSFNDRPGRIVKIHGEVIAAFDAAIKLSKSRKKVTA
jgi:hypothetical protein